MKFNNSLTIKSLVSLFRRRSRSSGGFVACGRFGGIGSAAAEAGEFIRRGLLSLVALAIWGWGSLGLAANNIFSVGDVIKINFAHPGPGPGVLPDWNLMRENTILSAGTVTATRSGQIISNLAGVSLGVNGNGANMDSATANWPGFGSDPYYVPQAYGLVYANSPGLGLLGSTYELNLTVSGLDTNAFFNVRVYRLINEGLANFSAGVTNGNGYDINTNISRTQVFNQAVLDPRLIFNNVRPDSLGRIIVSTASTQPTGMEAVVLEMIPEPSSFSLLVIGLGGLIALRRVQRTARLED